MRHEPPAAAGGAGARPGRQGHHVRHRRDLDQAGGRHGAHEGRHGAAAPPSSARCARSRCSRRRSTSIGIVPTTENMPGGRAVKPGDVLTSAVGQDGRSDEHGRRGPADPRRRAVVRAQARRDASRRRRDADGRVRGGARQGASALFGRPDDVGRRGAAEPRETRGRTLLAHAALRRVFRSD